MLGVARGPGSRRSAGIVDMDFSLLFVSMPSGNYLVIQYSETDIYVRLGNGIRGMMKVRNTISSLKTDECKKIRGKN